MIKHPIVKKTRHYRNTTNKLQRKASVIISFKLGVNKTKCAN